MSFLARRVPEIVTHWEDRSLGIRTNSRQTPYASLSSEPTTSQQPARPLEVVPDPILPQTRRYSGLSQPLFPLPEDPIYQHRPEPYAEPSVQAPQAHEDPIISASIPSPVYRVDSATSEGQRSYVRVSNSQKSQNIQTAQAQYQQLDQTKYEINTLREERRQHQQTMSTLRTQMQEARDQIERGTAENVAIRQEVTRLQALLHESRAEVDRLNEEMFQRLDREEGLLDQLEAAHEARRRSVQAAEEDFETYRRRHDRGGKMEYIVARSVQPGSQHSSRRSKHHSSKRKR